MEELNKTQIVLLTLLVSFVTSIATGITTVTLMDQAPPAVVQTLNRVVEKTIETVVQPASVVTKEVKVLVKEEDLVANAFDKNSASVVVINSLEKGESVFAGIGIVASSDGMIVTDKNNITMDGEYVIRTRDGVGWNASVSTTTDSGLALLKVIDVLKDDKKDDSDSKKIMDSVKGAVGIEESSKASLYPVSFSRNNTVKTGQTIISMGGEMGDEVLVGIVSKIFFTESSSVAETIYTNILLSKASSGGPLLNTDGEVVGMNIVSKGDQYAIPASYIKALLNLKVSTANTIDG